MKFEIDVQRATTNGETHYYASTTFRKDQGPAAIQYVAKADFLESAISTLLSDIIGELNQEMNLEALE